MDSTNLEHLRKALSEFAKERDWDQFHSPKNLAMALATEAGELLEIFQWLTEEQSKALDPMAREAATHELADIQIYLIRLADKLGVNLLEAAATKMEINAAKYPVEKAKGVAKKYDQL